MKANRYHSTSIFLHWAIFLLFVTALTLIEYRGYLPKGEPLKKSLAYWHMLAGQTVLLFVVFRVAARFLFGVPRLADGPRWQIWTAHTVHALLYLLMFGLPITGILFNQAAGREINYFGLVLPQFIGLNKELGHTLHDVHEFLGNAVYYVVGLHILGALWHQFVRRDNALSRMLPGGAKG
jgi:cytochrome b561